MLVACSGYQRGLEKYNFEREDIFYFIKLIQQATKKLFRPLFFISNENKMHYLHLKINNITNVFDFKSPLRALQK